VVNKVDNTLNLLAKLQTRPAEETLKSQRQLGHTRQLTNLCQHLLYDKHCWSWADRIWPIQTTEAALTCSP